MSKEEHSRIHATKKMSGVALKVLGIRTILRKYTLDTKWTPP